MNYTYPLPTSPVVGTSALTAAIAARDKEIADLKAAIQAIVIPDVSGLASKAALSAVEAKIPAAPNLTPYAL